MPIGILKFKLPEECEEFELAQQAGALHCVLSELEGWLRAKTKYENIKNVTVEDVREKIRELKDEYEVKN